MHFKSDLRYWHTALNVPHNIILTNDKKVRTPLIGQDNIFCNRKRYEKRSLNIALICILIYSGSHLFTDPTTYEHKLLT